MTTGEPRSTTLEDRRAMMEERNERRLREEEGESGLDVQVGVVGVRGWLDSTLKAGLGREDGDGSR
jgi:hypothetical protein